MEIITPDYGLLAWQLAALVSLFLSTAALIQLARHPMESSRKALWSLLILLLPYAGVLIFAAMRSRKKG